MKRIQQKFLRWTAAVAVSFFVAGPFFNARADDTQIVTCHGKLTSNSGNELAGEHTLVFKLYSSESGGSVLWQETHTLTLETGGLFSVSLGSVVPFGDSFDFAAPAWVSVDVDGDGEMDPRMRLSASAYALNAERLGGLPASAYLHAADGDLTVNGAIRVGDTTNTEEGSIRYHGGVFEGYNGSTWITMMSTGLGDFADGGDSKGKDRSLGNDDAYALSLLTAGSDRVYIAADGRVGIGTTMPAAGTALDVNGTVRASGLVLVDGNQSDGRVLTSNALGEATWKDLGVSGAGNVNGAGTVGYLSKWSAGNELSDSGIVEDAVGNIGIGSSAPAAKLDVFGEVKAQLLTSEGAVSALNASVTNTLTAGNVSAGDVTSSGNVSSAGLSVSGAAALGSAAVTGPLSAGSVFAGNISAIDTVTAANVTTNDATVTGNVSVGATATLGGLVLPAGAFDRAVLVSDAMGNTSWDVVGNAGAGNVNGTGTAEYLSKWTAGNEQAASGILEDSNGNIGIGTTAPMLMLDVNGDARVNSLDVVTNFSVGSIQITDSALNGRILVSDNSGVATWMDPAFLSSGSANGTGTPQTMAMWAADGNSVTTSAIYQSLTGNVSLGAIVTPKKLTVTNVISPSTPATDNGVLVDMNGGGGFYASDSTAGISSLFEVDSGLVKLGSFSAHPLQLYTNSLPRMRINADGNVGVGSIAPVSAFEVAGGWITANAPYGLQWHSDPYGGGGDRAFIDYTQVTGEDMRLRIGTSNDAFDEIVLYQKGANRMTIRDGNVGIGVAQANTSLQIVANASNEGVVIGTSTYPGTWLGTNGLWVAGGLYSNHHVIGDNKPYSWGDSQSRITGLGGNTNSYISFATAGNEQARITNNGYVGVGTNVPVSKLDVADGWITASAPYGFQWRSDPGGGSGDRAFIDYGVVSGEVTRLRIGITDNPDDSLVFNQAGADRMTIINGNVGIGTTLPLEKLDVAGGNIKTNGNVLFSTGNIGIAMMDAVSGSPQTDGARIYWDENILGAPTADALVIEKTDFNGTDPDGGIVFTTRGSDNVRKMRLSIRGDGTVGVGSTQPAAKLDVAGTVAATGFRLVDGNQGANKVLVSDDNGNATWSASGGSAGVAGTANTLAMFTGTNAVGDSSVNQDAGGNIGIGMAASTWTKLTVNGALRTYGNVITDGGYLSLNDVTGSGTSGQIRHYSNDPTMFFVETNGQFAFGDAVDWDRTVAFSYAHGTVGAASGVLAIGQIKRANSSYFTHGVTDLYTNGSVRLRIDKNGNVGIGTINPTVMLDVNGDARVDSLDVVTNASVGSIQITDNAANGRILVSDNSGTGTWMNPSILSAAAANGSGTPWTMAMWAADGNSITTSAIYQSATGNVSLGGASTPKKLTVSNVASPATTATDNGILVDINGGGGLYASDSTAGIHSSFQVDDIGLKSGTLSNHPYRLIANNIERMRVNNNGRIGIGLTTPAAQVDVATASLGEFSGGNSSVVGSNLVLTGLSGSRTVGSGPSMTFAMPANTDGSNRWEQARILATPDSNWGGNAAGRLYFQTRSYYNLGSGSTWNWRTGLMIDSLGRVGVGTTMPQVALDVNGEVRTDSLDVVSGIVTSNIQITDFAAAGKILVSDNSGTGTWMNPSMLVSGNANGSGIPQYMAMWANGGNTVTTSEIYQTPTGNIAMGGTVAPKKLTVSNVASPSSAGMAANGVLVDMNGGGGFYASDSGAGLYARSEAYAGQYLTGTFSAHPYVFATNNVERMRIDTNGNLGVGVVTPNEKLTLPRYASIGWSTGGTVFSRITDNGDLTFWTDDRVHFSTNAGEALSISGGNVGIGTSIPEVKLEVLGTIAAAGFRLADGNQGQNKVLTSDGNGMATWTTFVGGGSGNGNVSGTVNKVAMFTAGNTVGDSVITQSGNNVGIGTPVPSVNLDVVGSAKVSGALTAAMISLTAPSGDPAPVITARTVPVGQGNANEKTELILFHSNDYDNGSGVDQITLRAPALSFQTYNNAAVNDINNVAGYNERMYITPVGNVGIGTTLPTAKLYVSGSATVGGLTMTAGAGNGKVLTSDPNGVASWQNAAVGGGSGNANASGTVNQLAMFTAGNAVGNSVITQSGINVGIGTTLPVANLHVGGGQNRRLRLGSKAVGSAVDNTTRGLERSRNVLEFESYSVDLDSKIGAKIMGINKQTYNDSSNRSAYQSTDLLFSTSPANDFTADGTVERMRITDGGYVGIGTAAPGAPLEVAGGTIMLNAPYGMEWRGNPYGGTGDRAFIDYQQISGENVRLRIGITDDPYDEIAFYENGSYRMTIRSGNVGIGSMQPAATLDVSGSAAITGNLLAGGLTITAGAGNGKVLASDANGVASWVNLGGLGSGNANAAGSVNQIPLFAGATSMVDSVITQNSSKIGIGSINPTYALEVNGDISVGSYSNTTATVPVYGKTLRFNGAPSNSDPLWMAQYDLASDQTELRVNIGDNNQSSDAFVLGYTSGGNWYPVLRTDMGGTTTVNGLKMTANAGNGKVLTSDASGVATWSSLGALGGGNANAVGTVNKIALFTAGNAVGDSVIAQDAVGNIGIGTTAPVGKFDVRTTNNRWSFSDGDAVRTPSISIVSASGAGYKAIAIGAGTTSSYVAFDASGAFDVKTDTKTNIAEGTGAGGSSLVHVGANGNVGIGLLAPAVKLDVAGTVAATGLKVVDGNQGLNKVLTSDANGTATWAAVGSLGGGNAYASGTVNKIAVFTAGNAVGDSVVTQDVNGNIGVGTTAPTAKLDIQDGTFSTLKLGAFPVYASANTLSFNEKNSSPGSAVQTAYHFTSGSNTKNILFSFAKTGVDTDYFANDGTNYILAKEHGTGAFIFKKLVGFGTDISTTGVELMRVDSASGNVGIGTTQPAFALDVVGVPGSIRAKGTSGTSGVIRAEAPGGGYIQLESVNDNYQILRSFLNSDLRFGNVTDGILMTIKGSYLGTPGYVGIGTISPTSKLDVAGTITSTGLKVVDGNQGLNKVLMSDANGNASWSSLSAMGSGNANATGTVNKIAVFTAGNAVGDSVITQSGLNIGIGTTAPLGSFEVASSTTGRTAVFARGNDANFAFGVRQDLTSNLAGAKIASLGLDWTSIDISKIDFYRGTATGPGAIAFLGGGNERMRIDASGNVGIGSAQPTQRLDVAGSLKTSGTAAVVGLYSTAESRFSNGTYTDPAPGVLADAKFGNVGLVSGGNVLTLRNIGIGSTQPTQRLDVVGNAAISGNVVAGGLTLSANAGNGKVLTSDAGGNATWLSLSAMGSGNANASGTVNKIALFTAGNAVGDSAVIQDGNGNIGIGTTQTMSKLTLPTSAKIGWHYTAGNAITASITDSGYLTLWSDDVIALNTGSNGGAERLRVDANGNVGIGSTQPTAKLNVAGTVAATGLKLVDGNQGQSKVLMSDAGGNASWQTLSTGNAYASGTVNRLALFTAGNAVSDSVVMQDAGGNIGIGTSAPTAELQVLGNIRAGQLVVAGKPSAYSLTYAYGGYTPDAFMYLDSTYNSFRLGLNTGSAFATIALALAGQDVAVLTGTSFAPATGFDNILDLGKSGQRWKSLRVGTGTSVFEGNVGIGTTQATQRVVVSGNASVSGTVVAGGLTMAAGAGNGYIMTSDAGGNAVWKSLGSLGSGNANAAGTINRIALFTAGNAMGDSLIVQSGSNIGVGSTQPSAKLDVAGNVALGGLVVSAGNWNMTMTATAPLSIKNSGNTAFSVDTLSRASLAHGAAVDTISIDGNLGGLGANDTSLPTQKAVKTYVDDIIDETVSTSLGDITKVETPADGGLTGGVDTGIATLRLALGGVKAGNIAFGTLAGEVSADSIPNGATKIIPTLAQGNAWNDASIWTQDVAGNAALRVGRYLTLGELKGTQITAPAEDQVLVYTGNAWQNKAMSSALRIYWENIDGEPMDNDKLAEALGGKMNQLNVTPTRVLVSDTTGTVILPSALIDVTELNYLDGASSNIQTQLNDLGTAVGSAQNLKLIYDKGVNAVPLTPTGGNVRFYVPAGNEALTIAYGSGAIGIGTSLPTSQLHVRSTSAGPAVSIDVVNAQIMQANKGGVAYKQAFRTDGNKGVVFSIDTDPAFEIGKATNGSSLQGIFKVTNAMQLGGSTQLIDSVTTNLFGSAPSSAVASASAIKSYVTTYVSGNAGTMRSVYEGAVEKKADAKILRFKEGFTVSPAGEAAEVSFDVTQAVGYDAGNWNTAYAQRATWDGNSSALFDLTAAKTTLGLGTLAAQDDTDVSVEKLTVGTMGSDFVLPQIRGNSGYVLKAGSAGAVSWQPDIEGAPLAFATVSSDSGSVTAGNAADSLSVVGGPGIATSIIGKVMTVGVKPNTINGTQLADSVTIDNGAISFMGGNVGIGTTMPVRLFEVAGNAAVANTIEVTGDGNVGFTGQKYENNEIVWYVRGEIVARMSN